MKRSFYSFQFSSIMLGSNIFIIQNLAEIWQFRSYSACLLFFKIHRLACWNLDCFPNKNVLYGLPSSSFFDFLISFPKTSHLTPPENFLLSLSGLSLHNFSRKSKIKPSFLIASRFSLWKDNIHSALHDSTFSKVFSTSSASEFENDKTNDKILMPSFCPI